jgi:hypothetical protein
MMSSRATYSICRPKPRRSRFGRGFQNANIAANADDRRSGAMGPLHALFRPLAIPRRRMSTLITVESSRTLAARHFSRRQPFNGKSSQLNEVADATHKKCEARDRVATARVNALVDISGGDGHITRSLIASPRFSIRASPVGGVKPGLTTFPRRLHVSCASARGGRIPRCAASGKPHASRMG